MIRIAVVVQGKLSSGGVTSTARFIIHTLRASERYIVDLFFLANAHDDTLSSRLLKPHTWFSGVRIVRGEWYGLKTHSIGANLTEFEFQRYMPRRRLTELLNQYDLIQVVAGGPAVAYVTHGLDKPVFLFIATLARLERRSLLRQAKSWRLIYNRTMLPIVSQIERRALQCCHHIFAETEYTKQAILPYIDDSKVSVDTVGVDTTRFQPIADAVRTDDYILCTGRLNDPRKNVPLLLRAYAQLRRQMPGAPRLLLAGMHGPTESDWRLADDLKIRDHIEFRQSVPPEQLVRLYQNAAFFVLSSDEEGLGIVLLEAMACANPVISTRCGGPDSVVSPETGFLVPVGDAHAMAEQMRWMLTNPSARREMGRAGRQMVERRFSNEVVGQKYLDVYDRLLSQTQPRP